MSDRIIPQQSSFDVATFTLLSEGKEITYDYELLSLTVNREVNRIPSARLVFSDGSAAEETFAASEKNDLIPGVAIEIGLGYDSFDQTVFKGVIVKHALQVGNGGDSFLIVDCRDVAFDMTLSRQSRQFSEVKDSEAIATILKEYARISGKTEATKVKHPEIVQYYATDWDFVLSRAEMNGQIVLVEDGKLTVQAPTTNGAEILSLTYGANIIELDMEMDARSQYKSVSAQAWNPAEQTISKTKGKEPLVNVQGNLTAAKLATISSSTDPLELRHGGALGTTELQGWADAQMLKSRLGKIQGRVKIQGFWGAKPDALVKFEGMGDRFNGEAYVSGIRHEMNGGSWHTYLQVGLNPQWFYKEPDIVERPASGLLPGVSGLQVGTVVQLQDDPAQEDRVLVSMPIVDKGSSNLWARVATLDAGNKRGSFFRPEIGDEVVLGFLQQDPRYPVILGMLNSSKNPAPVRVEDANHQKGFFTRSGMKVHFDDDKKVMTLETPAGNQVVMSDDEKSIVLSDQNRNSVTLDNSGITLKSPKNITIEATGTIKMKATQDASLEGLNVNVKANTQFKATGNAGVEVSTSAIAVLKGSLVQIN